MLGLQLNNDKNKELDIYLQWKSIYMSLFYENFDII